MTRILVLDDEAFDPNLVSDFEAGTYLWSTQPNATITTTEIADGDPLEVPGQGAFEQVASVTRAGGGTVTARHEFPQVQDWSEAQAVSLLYYGRGTGGTVDVTLENNRTVAADADPATWKLAWRDEFNTGAGTAPDPQVWTHEIGDGTIIGKPGWGNDELQHYTDSTENAATDGQGNLVITTRATDSADAPLCYYGPCDYTSARLVTQNKVELQYGRIESRVQVPRGAGLWPAVWALGADINRNPWPQSGEIDIMENVGREPYTVFGTIHGPGYSGGQSFGGTWDFDVPVADTFHTFVVEWAPGEIRWSVDGIQFHEAAPADVDPNEWVFEHPFFLLMNVAVGGNFGGAVGEDTEFPQTMKVDYVRVYQPVERPIPFTARFTDDLAGWREVVLPLAGFTGRPGSTLDVTDVRALTVTAPATRGVPMLLDQVRVVPMPPPTEIVVTSLANSGPGSLREALGAIAPDGTITFDPALAGGTVPLSGGPLVADRSVTVDGSGAPGLAVDGGGAVRVLEVAAGAVVAVSDLTLTDGYGFDLGGAVLNNGSLTLDHVVVSDSRVTTGGIDFWKGGAGIYTGENGVLVLRDSTVRNNSVTGGAGGGVYGFFRSDVTIERTTISGNSANDVGGGVRSLGTTRISNSTISGNASTGWHGGGVFHTDGALTVSYSTVSANNAPGGLAGGLFMGSFGAGGSAALEASIVAGNSGDECIVFYGGPFTMESLGSNVLGDASCGAAAATDQVGVDALLGPLGDNGGPTLTHALLAGSPAIDAAEAAPAPATDQRGVPRPQGAGPDVGAFELE